MKQKSSFRSRHRLPSALACTIALTGFAPAANAAYEHMQDPQDMSQEQREILPQEDARRYMLKLINRDRATVGAPPVVLDDIGTQAGQAHSDEMAVIGYLSHWAMDGRKPDERYNDAGGKDADAENAFVNFEGSAAEASGAPNKLPLHSAQMFHRYELEQIESGFFNEKPPYDGHRQNIINPIHTSVGIALSYASNFGMGVRTACTQEFINHYGEYADIPKSVALGNTFTVKGILAKNVHLKSIDMRREDMPKPMTVAALGKTSSYGSPNDIITACFPGFSNKNAAINVKQVDGLEQFSVDVATDKTWQPGLYYIITWAQLNGAPQEQMISTRTIELTVR